MEAERGFAFNQQHVDATSISPEIAEDRGAGGYQPGISRVLTQISG